MQLERPVASRIRVRTLGVATAVSLVVHGAALAWVLREPKPEPARVVAVQAPEPAPVTVELVEDPPAVVVAVAPRDDRATVAPARPRPTATGAIRAMASRGTPPETVTREPAGEPAPVVEAPRAPVKKMSLSMRSGVERMPSVAEQLADRVVDMPAPGPLPDYPGNRAKYAYENAKARGDYQGMVDARDAANAEELKEQKDGTFRSDEGTFRAKVNRDGTVALEDKPNLQRHGLGASFDVTDFAMRATGVDPYASAKRAYLDRTRDQRVLIGKRDRTAQLAESARRMQENLVRAWQLSRDVAARKQAVFELWDEVAETGDAELVEGGEQARALLSRWVQIELAGASAYTADELRSLNAKKHSTATFDPYR